MRRKTFREMSDEELAAFEPRNESEAKGREDEQAYRKYCKDQGVDHSDDAERECYEAQQDPWNELSEDDRAGMEDNLHRED